MTPAWFPDTLTPDLDRGLHYTLQWGLEGMVLRSFGTARVPDVNEQKLKRRLAETEVAAVAADAGIFEGPLAARATWLNDLQRLAEAAAFCARVGCPLLLTGTLGAAPPEEATELLRRGAEVAARYGVWVAVRAEEGQPAAALAARLEATGTRLRACWDPALSAAAGESPEAGADAIGARTALVVYRPGTAVPWDDVLRRLLDSGFDGAVCLDASGLKPRDALREATALVYLLRDVRRER